MTTGLTPETRSDDENANPAQPHLGAGWTSESVENNAMNCQSCGTRTSPNQRHCPNGGRSLAARGGATSPNADASSSGQASRSLSPSTAKAPGNAGESPKPVEPKSSRRNKKKEQVQSVPEIPLEELSHSSDSDMEAGESRCGVSQIRALIHDRPDCLEQGLSIYTDKKTEPVGIDFSTEVGNIDLLARDDAGGLVVILIPDASSPEVPATGKDTVSDALERVGWVRKHIAEQRQEVRAIVLLDQVPDDISYSASAVASTIAFKTYRLEINFSDVEL